MLLSSISREWDSKGYSPVNGGIEAFQEVHGIVLFRGDYAQYVDDQFCKAVTRISFPILIAIMLNDLKNKYFKKFAQTVSYMPNFMSWVVVSGIIVAIFSTDGAANNVLNSIGCPPVSFLSQSSSFLKIIIISDVWKYAGWDSIIYSAAIMSIDPTLYEAASMDGAGKLRQIWHVTLPGISSVIAITLILRMEEFWKQVLNRS